MALYSACFSAAIRWVSGSVGTKEVAVYLSLIIEALSNISSSRSADMVSRILLGDRLCELHDNMEDAPSDRADEIEVDNGAPCYSFGLKRSGGVQELELCEME
jgi:hypothetical protein